MTLKKLYDMVNEYTSFSYKPELKRYNNGDVIDEDKSVKWNREQVEILNKKYNDKVKELNTKGNLMYTNLVNGIKEYIIEETKVSKKQADKIYNYLYDEYHSHGIAECLNHLDDLLDLFK